MSTGDTKTNPGGESGDPEPSAPRVAQYQTPRDFFQGQNATPTHCGVNLGCGKEQGIQLNPKVFFASLVVIWVFIIWAMADPDNCYKQVSKVDKYLVNNFSWFYVGAVNCFLFFSVYLAFSKYGDIRLAKDDTVQPDFGYASWFAMLFSAGIGIGLFFWGVGEPVLHYGWVSRHNHIYMQDCTDSGTASSCFTPESRDIRMLWAMNISWYHWGFGASCCYVVVGLPIAYYHYKHGRPLTMRTSLYPLLGNRVNGWFGDLVEIFSVLGTLYGVCTSLGLGVNQIGAGMVRLWPDLDNKKGGTMQIIIIWVVTGIATVSVVTGLEVGIRRISEVNFILGIFILGMIFFASNSVFLLDFLVEEVGFHVNYMLRLSFAAEGLNKAMAFQQDDKMFTGGYSWSGAWANIDAWASNWTIFYWAWWISWAPFVGLFIARISKGRTIREFILGNMFVPTLVTSIWMLIFGGAGLYHQFLAENAGMTCADCKEACEIGSNGCGDDGMKYINGCPLLICRGWNPHEMLFDVIEMYPFRDFMTACTTLGIALYFVTSSDSASAVIDQISSNGMKEGPVWQRVFWAVSEGATATAVLVAGKDNGLKALRSISIISAFPFCILMCLMMWVFIRFIRIDNDPEAKRQQLLMNDWNVSVPDSFLRTLVNNLTLGCFGKATKSDDSLLNHYATWVFPPFNQLSVARQVSEGGFVFWAFFLIVPFMGIWVFGIIAACEVDGFMSLFGMCWITFVVVGVALRSKVRERFNISGTFLGDLCTYMWCGPCAGYQEWMAVMKGHIRPYGTEGNDGNSGGHVYSPSASIVRHGGAKGVYAETGSVNAPPPEKSANMEDGLADDGDKGNLEL